MKKLSHLLLMIAAGAFIFMSCEGPAGPQGETGAQGIQGIQGIQGVAGPTGAAGTAGCIVCHDDSQLITAVSGQWEASVHAMGGNFERNDASCSVCHTSQGFVAKIGGTAPTTAVSNPAPINCYTCHNIHETWTGADLALKTTAPVTFMVDGEVSDQGNSNLCINCHQSRDSYSVPNAAAVADDSLNVSSSRYGPHHGPQGNTFAGVSTVEFAGTAVIPTSNVHSNASCIMCHMQEPYGVQAGGHTWDMNYEYHGADALYVEDCLACHDSETEATLHTKSELLVAEVDGLLDALATSLVARGVMSGPDANGDFTQLTGKFKEIEAGAIWNWKFFGIEDPGAAFHNPKYVKAVLKNSKEAVDALPALPVK